MNTREQLLQDDPKVVAEAADLRYVNDEEPGIRRKRWGRGFAYFDPQGKHIKDPELRARFEALAIPPAWRDVWICTDERCHIQVTGRDDRGRKQYIYHPRWQEVRQQNKFNRMVLLGEALPALREQVDQDLRKHGIPRERVVAAVVRLLQETLIRVGNTEYARTNSSYGLTTLQMRHVALGTNTIHFEFQGKRGKEHTVDVTDPRAARVMRYCQELPGQELFQYVDDHGTRHTVESADVNEYVRTATGSDFTAKDFRTWGGTVRAVRALHELGPAADEQEQKEKVGEMFERVSSMLGNTRAVCREYYVHPQVVEAYREGAFEELWEAAPVTEDSWLHPEEQITLHILRQRLGIT